VGVRRAAATLLLALMTRAKENQQLLRTLGNPAADLLRAWHCRADVLCLTHDTAGTQAHCGLALCLRGPLLPRQHCCVPI
jgi:hypothetical protein